MLISTLDIKPTERLRNKIRKIFEDTDTDGSATISIDEIEDLCSKLGQNFSKDDVKIIQKRLDANDDGTVDRDEFENVMIEYLYMEEEKINDEGPLRKW